MEILVGLAALGLRILDIFVFRFDELWGEILLSKALGFLLVWGYLVRTNRSLAEIGLHRRNWGKAIGITLIGVIPIYIAGYGLAALTAQARQPVLLLAAIDPKTGMAGGWAFGLFLVVGNFVNSFMEEGLFRGVLLRRFQGRFPFWWANLFQAALFALWHWVWPVKHALSGVPLESVLGEAGMLLVSTMISGLAYGYLYFKTDSLWAPWLAHTLNNTILNWVHLRTVDGLDSEMMGIGTVLVLGLLLLMLCTRWAARRAGLPELAPWGAGGLRPRRWERWGLGLLALGGGAVFIGAGYQMVGRALDARYASPPGVLIDVGGYRLHLDCVGEGSPTVILEGGDVEWSSFWGRVQPEIGKRTRVCAYDRAGYGWSDPAPGPRTIDGIVDDLHTLLERAGVPGPYVLVAHSAGGLYSRYYQARYPDEVAGMVLVESTHESLLIPLPGAYRKSLSWVPACRSLLVPLGGLRLLRPLPSYRELKKLPEALQAPALARLNRPDLCDTYEAEIGRLQANAERLQATAGTLGDLPLVVIRAAKFAPEDWPGEARWISAQERLAELSTRGELWAAEESLHYVQLDQPELVVAAVRRVIPPIVSRAAASGARNCKF